MGRRTITQSCEGRPAQQPLDDLIERRNRPGFDLLLALILNRMRHIDGFKVGPSERAGLRSRRHAELVGDHRHCRNPFILQPDGIVQTARGAGASVRQRLHHRIDSAEALQRRSRCRFGESGFHLPHHARHPITLLQ